MTLLSGVRVLDIADSAMGLTAQVLADLGADVVRFEPNGGRADDWTTVAYDRNKRILEGELDETLLAGVDVLVESPRADGSWRFDPRAIGRTLPHLVHVTVSWFGRTGPKANYAGTDLIATAASGFLHLTGAPGSAPLRISAPQAALHAAADGAVGALIALRSRDRSGRGQHIDSAAQDSLTLALLGRALDAAVGQPRAERSAGKAVIGGLTLRYVYPTRDGFALVQPAILPPVAAFGRRLAQWLILEGLLDARFADWDWGTAALRMMGNQIDPAEWGAIDTAIAQLLATRTKAELMTESLRRKVLVAPLFTVADLLTSEQLSARRFVRRDAASHHLGPFAAFSASPLPDSKPPVTVAPRSLAESWSARRLATSDSDEAPLAGIKIVDLFWVVAGPGATRMLADYGATVVHVESRDRLDMARAVAPYIDATTDPERAALFHSTNANKLGVAIDLGTDAGRAVLKDLIAWADVFTESFSAGAIARMGFDYATVKAINPRIIMISSCLLGQTGPWKDYAGFGNLAAAVTGFHELTGQRGETPTGCYGPYTDFVGVRYNAIAILAALAHRDRTGEGQFIDMAQAEAALHFLAPAACEYWQTGSVPTADGNRDRTMTPHSVYPAAGADSWIAIAIRHTEDWQRLCTCGSFNDWARDPALSHAAGRRAREAEIDERIGAWTRTVSASELEAMLQAAGVPAHAVSDTPGVFADEQLKHRRHFHRIAHAQFGHTTIESSRLVFSRSSPRVPELALTYGRDNGFVLEELLGYTKEKRSELERRGVLQ